MFIHIAEILEQKKNLYREELAELEAVQQEVEKELEAEKQLELFQLSNIEGNQ